MSDNTYIHTYINFYTVYGYKNMFLLLFFGFIGRTILFNRSTVFIRGTVCDGRRRDGDNGVDVF